MPNNVLRKYGSNEVDSCYEPKDEAKSLTQSKAAWDLLPDDALLEIFSFLSVKELGRLGK